MGAAGAQLPAPILIAAQFSPDVRVHCNVVSPTHPVYPTILLAQNDADNEPPQVSPKALFVAGEIVVVVNGVVAVGVTSAAGADTQLFVSLLHENPSQQK